MLIRPYVSTDKADVLELHASSHEEVEVSTRREYFDDLESIDEVYLQEGTFLVAQVNDRLVGMVGLLRLSSESAEIKRMRVRPECQRQGIGKALLRELEESASQMGIRHLHLNTLVVQERAQLLYESSGYRSIRRGEVDGYPVIFYTKDLRAGRQ